MFGEGYAFRIGEVTGGNDVTGRGGAIATLLRGENKVSVVLDDQADGRDALADAAVIVRQIVEVLDLPRHQPSLTPTP